MDRSRRLLMVAFVATALAADRAIAAAPSESPPMTQAARRLAGRLVVSFRQVVAPALYRPYRQEKVRNSASIEPLLVAEAVAPIHPVELSPFQHRLPPPQL